MYDLNRGIQFGSGKDLCPDWFTSKMDKSSSSLTQISRDENRVFFSRNMFSSKLIIFGTVLNCYYDKENCPRIFCSEQIGKKCGKNLVRDDFVNERNGIFWYEMGNFQINKHFI